MEPLETKTEKTEQPVGPVIGIILIIVMILIGGYYFLSQRITKLEREKQNQALNQDQNSTTTIATSSEI